MKIFVAAAVAVLATAGLAAAAPTQTASYELDATARIVVYVPTGYGVALGQPAGTQIGTIDGGSITIGGSARDLSGTIVTDDPAKHTSDVCAPGSHAGVWILNATAADIFTWRAYVTPYTLGTATANAAGTTEVRSDVPVPYRVALKATKDKKGTTAIIGGTVLAAGHAV